MPIHTKNDKYKDNFISVHVRALYIYMCFVLAVCVLIVRDTETIALKVITAVLSL